MFLFGMRSVWTEIKHGNQNTVQMLYPHLKTLRLLFLYLWATLTKQASKLVVAIATGARFSCWSLEVFIRGFHMFQKMKAPTGLGL